jgi:hypothetical protein
LLLKNGTGLTGFSGLTGFDWTGMKKTFLKPVNPVQSKSC